MTDLKEEKRAQFFELEKTLDALDNRLEIYEDLTEDQYETGEISVNDFLTMERKIEQLEDVLDSAEDDLERLFGYFVIISNSNCYLSKVLQPFLKICEILIQFSDNLLRSYADTFSCRLLDTHTICIITIAYFFLSIC